MAPLRFLLKAAALFLLIPTALGDTLNRTMCYCGTAPNQVNQLDTLIEAGCYYFFEYHSNPYNMTLDVDYTCRSTNYDNACTMRYAQKQARCRTYDEGWEFCYDQNGKKIDRYSFMGVRHGVGGVIVTPPKAEVEAVCDNLCMKHVGLPRIPKPWDIANLVGHIMEWRGESKIELFPELPDIVLPHRGFPDKTGPTSDEE